MLLQNFVDFILYELNKITITLKIFSVHKFLNLLLFLFYLNFKITMIINNKSKKLLKVTIIF